MYRFCLILFSALVVLVAPVSADVPQLINYQGRLTDPGDNPVTDGVYQIVFTIYDTPTGSPGLWYSGMQPVQVTGGLFTYLLGSVNQLPDSLFEQDTLLYLGIKVETDPEIVPRVRLTSVGHAYHSLRSDSADYAHDVADYCITTHKLEFDAVTGAKILDNTVTASDLGPGSVGSYQIMDDGILFIDIGPNGAGEGEVMKMIGGNWTAAADETGSGGGDITAVYPGTGLTGGGTSGDVTLSVGTGAITSAHIASDAITSTHIADNSVGTGKIQNAAVTTDQIANGAITYGKIADAAVAGSKISDGTVSNQKLSTNAVTSVKIQDGTIDSSDVADGGLSLDDLAQSGADPSEAIAWIGGRWQPTPVGDITAVYAMEFGGLQGGGESGDVSLALSHQGVTAWNILDSTITDADVHQNAAIEPTKIRGTAVNLSDAQTISGTKTFEDLNIETTTRRVSISNAAFVPRSNSQGFYRNSNYIRNATTGYWNLFAQVSLPDGASVTRVKATYYDNEASYFGKMELFKVYMVTGSEIKMAEMQTSGTPGMTTISDASIVSESISNDGYNYYLISTMSFSTTNTNMRLYGAEIEYTITRPLP